MYSKKVRLIMKKQVFEQEIKTYETLLKKQTATYKKIGYIKLFHVAFMGYFIYQIFTLNDNIILLMISGVIILLLIGFWIFHAKLREGINYSKGMIQMNQCQLDRITGAWVGFADLGWEFVNHDHPYASDLDIVGQKSIFQFLNSTNTWHGRQQFASDLLDPNYTTAQIQARQKAVVELSDDIPFVNRIKYQFAQIGVHGAAKFIPKWLADKRTFLTNSILKALAIYVPLINLLLAIFVFLTRQTTLYTLVFALFFCQLLIWGASFFKTGKYLDDISHLSYNLEAYTDVIQTIQAHKFSSSKLVQIQQNLAHNETSAYVAIKELARLSGRANMRRNSIAFVILNLVLLYDITTAIGFQAWKEKYAQYAEDWFINLGEFESLLSFSNLPNVITNVCLPEITQEKCIKANEMGHPLIVNEKRINNDVNLNDDIFIISGSNMSGKTTFMRTVGVNLVLARAGSFVCAQKMNTSQFEMITSMRIADDLNEGISTFYAELKRVKSIVELAKKEAWTIFFIDEIFRGTNSVDRLIGAKTILEKLDAIGVVGMITTHDLELCKLAETNARIKNFSFMEHYGEKTILFDYKLHKGKSQTTNAEYLMRMMEIF